MRVRIQINPAQKTGSSLNQRKKAFCQVFQAVLLSRATDVGVHNEKVNTVIARPVDKPRTETKRLPDQQNV